MYPDSLFKFEFRIWMQYLLGLRIRIMYLFRIQIRIAYPDSISVFRIQILFCVSAYPSVLDNLTPHPDPDIGFVPKQNSKAAHRIWNPNSVSEFYIRI